jgi:hypothetical protein
MLRLAALGAIVIAIALPGTIGIVVHASHVVSGLADSQSVVGTLAKYEAASRTLSVATASGIQRFVLAATTPVRLGSRVLKPQDLTAHKGAKVKVRFSEAGGKRKVESVMVSAANESPVSFDATSSDPQIETL